MNLPELESELAALEAGYSPNPEVADTLRQTVMAPLIGPVAVGKSTCIDFIIENNSDFGRVQSFTTRAPEPRDAEDQYNFLPHDESTLASILDKVRKKELVQFLPHPTTGFIYGSDLSQYERSHTLLDALANSIAALRALPFKEIVEITVVADPPEWYERFRRRSQDKDDAGKRIDEGIKSLEWSLEQGDEMNWVTNGDGPPIEACDEIVGLIQNTRESDPANRKQGEVLLGALKIYAGD